MVVPADVATAALARLTAALPFALTPSQARAVATLAADLGAPRAMERLLIGDVGSGKTAVALAAATLIAGAGGQTLMMVPTEALAEQQGRALAPLAAGAGPFARGSDRQPRRRGRAPRCSPPPPPAGSIS